MIRKQYISNYIVFRSHLYVNNVMRIDGTEVILTKFNEELAHTEYVAGIVAIVDNESVAEDVVEFVKNSSGDKSVLIEHLKKIGEPISGNPASGDDLIILQIIPGEKIVRRLS